jgi:hypothetical protein
MAEHESTHPEPDQESGDPGSEGRDPHHVLNNPARDPDPTEWPDPYDKREDPRDPPDPDGLPFGEAPHPPTGATSTSDPRHAADDPEVEHWKAPERDKMDD